MDIAFWLGMALVTVLAAWMRVRDVAMVSVLQDTVGPFWASLRLDGRTHVPGSGVAMLLPYWLVLSFSENLWMALSGFAWIHGLVAPVGMWIARRRMASILSGSLLVGIVLAFDPGLMSSVQSGAEGYLAPLFQE